MWVIDSTLIQHYPVSVFFIYRWCGSPNFVFMAQKWFDGAETSFDIKSITQVTLELVDTLAWIELNKCKIKETKVTFII